MNTPVRRIQRKREKGWRMPENTVSVDRPTQWGNPFTVEKYGREKALEFFRIVLTGDLKPLPEVARADYRRWEKSLRTRGVAYDPAMQARIWLRGKNLASWCPLCPAHQDGKPWDVVCADCSSCHADTLLEIANSEEYSR